MREGQVKLITGPNSSGKSVYLKQVGLIVFLAHIGSFIPADSATIGVVDRIFSRISSRETVSLAQSTFLIDVNQIATMIKHTTERSLLLIDEFGKGTDSSNGIALLSSFIQNLLLKKEKCPKTFITTHYSEIIEQNLIDKSDTNLELLTTEVLVQDVEEESLVFLYKLIKGWQPFSYASHCARIAGIPEELIYRSEEVRRSLNAGEPITKIDSIMSECNRKNILRIAKAFLNFDGDNDNALKFVTELVTHPYEE